MKNFILILLILTIPICIYAQNTGTGIVNNGAIIKIDEGAKIAIEGENANYVNYTNVDNGRIALSGTMEIAGDWENNSSTSEVFVNYGNNAEVIFSSDNQHEIRGTSPTDFYDISLQNNLTLFSDLNILQTLSMDNSLLNIEDYNLIMLDGSSINGTFSSNNMIIANGNGVVQYKITENGEFIFPVGDETYYSPVVLDFISGSYSDAYVAINVTNSKHPENTSTTDFLQRYWTVTQSGISSFNCDAIFNYVDSDINGTEANIYGAYFNGTNWQMINQVNADENLISGTMNHFGDISGIEYEIINIKESNFNKSIVSFSYKDKIYISSDNQIFNGQINIYNLLGQKLISTKFINNQVNEIDLNGQNNCYIIRIIGDNVNYSKTFFVE